jgi:precorrin-6A synthase
VRHIAVIGIGAGDPEQITVQAIGALNRLDVAFVVEKAARVNELSRVRADMIGRYRTPERPLRVVHIDDPQRDRAAAAYPAAVDAWRAARAEAWEAAIGGELRRDELGGFLVWGDPALYDSTIAVLETIRKRGRLEFDFDVVPGISSVQALAARHRVPLNRVGASVQITTGRRLAEVADDVRDVVVMLDPDCRFTELAEPDDEIFWGAYLGTPDEIAVSGPVGEVGARIAQLRSEARARKGWVMDTYLLRRCRT